MAKDHRPAMNPKITSNSANRVKKWKASTKKWKGHNGSALEERFNDTVNNYRIELASETKRQLAQTENDLDKQLAHISAEFGGKLRLVAEYEDDIFKSVSDERLEITSAPAEKDGQSLKQHANLADRMREFEGVVAAESAHLEKLWKEWRDTNLELVCLAIQVLGPKGVEFAPEQDDTHMAAKMTAAADVNREHEARSTELKEQAADLERSIQSTAEETINNLNEQEKEWKINEKRKIQKIKQIMMEAD